MIYRLCDITLDSEYALPELELAELATGSRYCLHRGITTVQQSDQFSWFHEWRYPNHELWSQFARTGAGYLCRFHQIADFAVDLSSNEVICNPVAGVPETTLAHIFLNQIVPLLLSANTDHLVLHGSAVAIAGQAVAFLAVTGAGKSTLAAAFCRAGYSLVTDDFLVIADEPEGIRALPTYGGLRLWDDMAQAVASAPADAPVAAHYTDKKRIDVSALKLPFQRDPLPLDRIYLLESSPQENAREITVRSVGSSAAVVEFTRFAFHLDPTQRESRQTEFARAAVLAAQVPCFRLAYPRDLKSLPLVLQTIVDHGRV